MKTQRGSSFLALLVLGCAARNASEAPQQRQLVNAVSTPDRLAPSEYLPGDARAVLRTRMANHARDMGALTSAIMVLRYPEIRERALAISEEPRFARPMTADATEVNSALPEKLLVYERELRVFAAALASGAETMNAFAVAEVFGRMSETCVKCHATYRAGSAATTSR
jgi:hypothetical protein